MVRIVFFCQCKISELVPYEKAHCIIPTVLLRPLLLSFPNLALSAFPSLLRATPSNDVDNGKFLEGESAVLDEYRNPLIERDLLGV